jgi:hypothetical protein
LNYTCQKKKFPNYYTFLKNFETTLLFYVCKTRHWQVGDQLKDAPLASQRPMKDAPLAMQRPSAAFFFFVGRVREVKEGWG